MKRNDVPNMRSDCPGLDGGPVSAEHERRFAKHDRDKGSAVSSGVSDRPDARNAQNPEKSRVNES
jgi:hypothetical protein